MKQRIAFALFLTAAATMTKTKSKAKSKSKSKSREVTEAVHLALISHQYVFVSRRFFIPPVAIEVPTATFAYIKLPPNIRSL